MTLVHVNKCALEVIRMYKVQCTLAAVYNISLRILVFDNHTSTVLYNTTYIATALISLQSINFFLSPGFTVFS